MTEQTEASILARLNEIYLEITIEHETTPGMRLMRELWHESWKPILDEQYQLRKQLKEIRVDNPAYLQTRAGYAVAGWSEQHGYFRNRYDIFDTLEQARVCMKELKDNPKWQIPTIIVKVTYPLEKSADPENFETSPINQMGSTREQEVIEKNNMGSKVASWSSLLACGDNGGFTY